MNPETLRCRILDYTKREMYQHGADGLTMDDIARGMKMSKRTLYKPVSYTHLTLPTKLEV